MDVHVLSREATVKIVPSEKVFTLKRNIFTPLRSELFRGVDHFSEVIWYTGKEIGGHKSCLTLAKMAQNLYFNQTLLAMSCTSNTTHTGQRSKFHANIILEWFQSFSLILRFCLFFFVFPKPGLIW